MVFLFAFITRLYNQPPKPPPQILGVPDTGAINPHHSPVSKQHAMCCPFCHTTVSNSMADFGARLSAECALRVRALQAGSWSRMRSVAAGHRMLRHCERGFAAEAADSSHPVQHREAPHLKSPRRASHSCYVAAS